MVCGCSPQERSGCDEPYVRCGAGLASVEDTECIVAKAIRDGGVDAVLDHANGWMLSKDIADVYATAEPAAAFHARVAFCLDIHNEVPHCWLCTNLI